MSLRSYSSYEESGLEWLGRAPSHWKVKRLRFTAELNPSKKEVAGIPRETVVSFLPMEAIGDDGSLDLERTRALGEVETSYTFFRNDDVVFAKITPCFENGKGAVVHDLTGGFGFGTTELIVARPRAFKATSSFLHWLFVSAPFRQLGEAEMYGAGGQKRVPEEFVRNFATAWPPVDEQACISAFLDRETGKIDALVAEQERLIELLKEKRQAVISHAVTKGLDPTVPMKDSGIEWLGKVPAHWEVLRLKRDMMFLTSGSRGWAEHYADDGAVFIRIGNLTRDSINLDLSEVQRVVVPNGAEGERTLVKAGDLLFSITAFLGSIAVAPDDLETSYVSQHVALCRLRQEKFLPSWVAYVTLSSVGKTYLESQGYGGTKVQLSLDDIENLVITAPPKEEQKRVIDFVVEHTSRISQLIAEAQRAIDLLKEHRSALISAAVTGKIDVRGLVDTKPPARALEPA